MSKFTYRDIGSRWQKDKINTQEQSKKILCLYSELNFIINKLYMKEVVPKNPDHFCSRVGY